jgi:hypothetical protein
MCSGITYCFEVSGQLRTLAILFSGKDPACTHLIESWMSSRTNLNAVEKRIIYLLATEPCLSNPYPTAIPNELWENKETIQSEH